MRKLLLATLVALFLAGPGVQACNGMQAAIEAAVNAVLAQAAKDAAAAEAAQNASDGTSSDSGTSSGDESSNEQPVAPPPPPPPVFVSLPPDSVEASWEGIDVLAPEQAAPIQLEETVVIS